MSPRRAVHISEIAPTCEAKFIGSGDHVSMVFTINYSRPQPWPDANCAIHQLLVELCAEFEQTDTGSALAECLKVFDSQTDQQRNCPSCRATFVNGRCPSCSRDEETRS